MGNPLGCPFLWPFNIAHFLLPIFLNYMVGLGALLIMLFILVSRLFLFCRYCSSA